MAWLWISGRTLRYYKASFDQLAGFHPDIFLLMSTEAKKYNSAQGDIKGGICIDEMSIQEDLCFVKTHEEAQLIWFVDLGEDGDNLRILTGQEERSLATHVLQFVYLGINSLRFPFACFPVTQTKAGNLHFLFWKAVKFLICIIFKSCLYQWTGYKQTEILWKFNSTPKQFFNFEYMDTNWFRNSFHRGLFSCDKMN